MGLLPAAVLADPEHPWLRLQEARLPRGVLGVIYYRDAVELVTPQGVQRRPFTGAVELHSREPAPVPTPAPSAKQITAAERAKAWRAANREKVKAQHQRKAQQRRAARDQLRDALAASCRAS
ncbi:hypothetical protein [Phenylobacterium sp.]|uniref:hypothetical protein n=1 Tax=Phenylobacterium sp. TaxID=1871053 RepID=UPI0035AD9E8B